MFLQRELTFLLYFEWRNLFVDAVQYYEFEFLEEYFLKVKYFLFVLKQKNLLKLNHQDLNLEDVKYIFFHHLYNELKQFLHFDLDHIE